MQHYRSKDVNLSGRTILIAPSALRALVVELDRYGARVINWPEIEIGDPESFTALDEAIENLFGYDWLISEHPAVDYSGTRSGNWDVT